MRRGHGRHLRVVEGRGYLDDVRSHEVHSREAAEDPEDLAAREPTGLRRPRPRSEGGIEHVDVDRHVDGRVAEPGADPVRDRLPAFVEDVHGRHDLEPEPSVIHEVLRGEQRAADPDVRGLVLEQQTLLPGPSERRPVRVLRAEVRVPRVEVRIEVDERDGSVTPVHGPQQRQRDRVVTPDREQVCGSTRGPSSAAASICEIASAMSNGLHATSPASATCCAANGWTSRLGW